MRVYDISVPIHSGMPVYRNDRQVEVTRELSLANGDHANVTSLHCSVHTGTHVDAPRHFIADGAGVEELDLSVLMGPCRVVEIPQEARTIDREVLSSIDLEGCRRLLLKTGNARLYEEREFSEGYVALNEDAARLLAEQKVKLVGIEYLSIESSRSTDNTVHKALLAAGIIILEGLNLSQVPPGDYELLCLPLKIVGADGAPARAILMES